MHSTQERRSQGIRKKKTRDQRGKSKSVAEKIDEAAAHTYGHTFRHNIQRKRGSSGDTFVMLVLHGTVLHSLSQSVSQLVTNLSQFTRS